MFENTKDLNWTQIEEKAKEFGLEFMRMLLEHRLESDPRIDPNHEFFCPMCGKLLRVQEAAQRHVVKTPFGEVAYERPYGICDKCRKSCVPLDDALGIPRVGVSVGTHKRVCHAAVVAHSFEDAADLLAVHDGLSFSRKHVRALAEAEGGRCALDRQQEVDQYRAGGLSFVCQEASPLLVVTCDGGRIQTRQEDSAERWKEDRIGAVYDAIPNPERGAALGKYEGAHATTKTYVATMQSWEAFGWMLRCEAERRGYERARQKVFLGDGAVAILELHRLHFPDAVFILDWAHAVEHLSGCAKAMFGEGTSRFSQWFNAQKEMLWEGKLDEVIGELVKCAKRLGDPSPGESDNAARVVLHRNAFSYFPRYREAMNYPLFREKGFPIGSGVAESAVKQFAIRMKGSEKFWNVSDRGANEMLALCALYYSEDGRWDEYWRRRSQPTHTITYR